MMKNITNDLKINLFFQDKNKMSIEWTQLPG